MPPPDKRRPFPDRAHEALATWVEETIAAQRVSRADIDDSFLLLDTLFTLQDGARGDIGTNSADLGDSLLLVDVLFGLLDSQMSALDAQAAEIAALNTRVTALEAPCSPDVAEA